MTITSTGELHRIKTCLRLALALCGLFWSTAGVIAAPNADTNFVATSGVFDVSRFGALGDGHTDDTAAIQKAVDACGEHGGGQVVLPGGGTFRSGAITLRSGVDFHLMRGAVLKGMDRWQDYGHQGALLFAKDATNISISGDGIIDGNDKAIWQKLADEEVGGDVNKTNWWPNSFCGDWYPFGTKPGAGRPMMVLLIGCQHVRLREVTLQNASTWTVHPVGCDDLVIDSISIHNDWNIPNNDGIDPDHCRNVRIANCHIDTADDGIVLKNTPNYTNYGACENVTVTGCVIASRSCALKLDEAYAAPGIRNVVFDSCVIAHSNRGLCIQSRDEGSIENVIFSNMIIETEYSPHKWWGAAEPISLTDFPRSIATHLGSVRHIRFSNIICRSESGVYIQGWKEKPMEDVIFDNVRVEIAKMTAVPGGFYDARPEGLFKKGIYTNVISGVYCQFVNGLILRDVQVIWGSPVADYYGTALDNHDIVGLRLENFIGKPADPFVK